MKGTKLERENGDSLHHLSNRVSTEEHHMLYTIVVILLVLWLIGNLTAYTAGGLIHILLVIAVIVIIVRVIQGRKPL
jgi:hypothetical protein